LKINVFVIICLLHTTNNREQNRVAKINETNTKHRKQWLCQKLNSIKINGLNLFLKVLQMIKVEKNHLTMRSMV
jgi:hypothetical protein